VTFRHPVNIRETFSTFRETKISLTNNSKIMIQNLIERYKEVKRQIGHSDEIYKYIAVQHFQQNWNINAEDFAGMLKFALSKHLNLIFNLTYTAINYVAKNKPVETRKLFEFLFDESVDLFERIKTFSDKVDKLIKEIDPKLQGMQDERSISIYLTFQFPDKYTFYKDSFYTKFCLLLGEKKAKKGEKYIQYLKLIKVFKEKYLVGDEELWQLTNATLPETAWKDENLNILAQDVLYVGLDQNPATNYWVFQCNPTQYDILSEWQNRTEETWSVSTYKKDIHPGDKVILWATGKISGCYGLCTVKSELLNDGHDYVELDIDFNLVNEPILKEKLMVLPEFTGFRGGSMGTNLKATKHQYQKILEMIENTNDKVTYEEGRLIEIIRKINNSKKVDFHFFLIDKIIERFKLKSLDKRIVLSTPKNSKSLAVTINQRYVLQTTADFQGLIIPQEYQGDYQRNKNVLEIGNYEALPGEVQPPIWVHFRESLDITTEVVLDWDKSVQRELSFGRQSGYLKYDNSAYRKAAFDKEYRERILQLAFSNQEFKKENTIIDDDLKPINIPQNLILYGPPGTGKTYQLIKNYIKYFTDKTDGKSKEVFTYELVSELKWWEVITLSLFELGKAKVNELIQHPLLAEKINQSENSKPRNTVWFWLQNHTKEDCKNVNVAKRSDPQIFWKDENSVWSIDKKLTEEMLPDLVEKLDKWKNFKPENKVTKRYEMITFHQSYSYEEFMEGIRPGFDEEEELRYKIEPGIFLRIAEKARKDYQNNYAIFIDEINRGNISKIFGELITLIEPDKRQGGENELEVILPYSKSKFSVPSNLYIIGTMNTADRSIALIDTALRRRFCFKEMMPDSSLLNDDVEEINLQLLLSKINERIEFLLDRDHTIGHSFFMKACSKNEICAIFKNKIVPLLQEYFYNDWEKVQLVLGDNKSWGKKEEQKLVRVKKHYDLSAEKELFGSDIEDFEDEIIYEINPALEVEDFDEIPVESFIHIYQKPGKTIF
jgi:hypothetical protein